MLRMVSHPHRPQSGHITCYLNRTYHVLPTSSNFPVEKSQSSPYRTSNIVRSGCAAWPEFVPPCSRGMREGFREHAVALSLLWNEFPAGQ